MPGPVRTAAAARPRTAAFSASDQALANILRAKSIRSRTTWAAAGRREAKAGAHAVDLALDAVAGDRPPGPALGHHRADPGLVAHAEQGRGPGRPAALGRCGNPFGAGWPRLGPGNGGRRREGCAMQHEMRGPGDGAACHRCLELCPGLEPLHGVGRRRLRWRKRRGGSGGQALAALGAASVDDGTASTGLHANQEAVGTRAAHFGGLVGAFHVASRENPTLSPKRRDRANAGLPSHLWNPRHQAFGVFVDKVFTSTRIRRFAQ